MGAIKAILFDFGGTLDYPRHWLDRFVAHYRACGVSLTRERLAPAFDYATQAGYAAANELRGYGLGELLRFLVSAQLDYLEREHLIDRQDLAGRELGRAALVDRISVSFATESRRGLEQSRVLLGALGERFRLGVVSNFYGNLDCLLGEAGLAAMLEVIADSSRLRCFKPDERIFVAALRELGLAPAEVAMVGDSPAKDCVPARHLGLTTVWLRAGDNLDPQAPSGTASFADHVIGSLDEVANLAW